MNRLKIFIWLTVAIAASPQICKAGVQRIVLEHADTLRSRGEVRELIGHVRVRRGITQIEADRAFHDTRSGQVKLTGAVKLREPSRRVFARQMDFNELSGNFEASQDVDMYHGDSLRIRCDRARYNEAGETVDLFGRVIIDNLSDKARITGGHGLWNQRNDSGVIDKSPVYRLPDTEGNPPDTLVIVSRNLHFNRAERTALFVGDVVMTRQDMRAEADSLLHLPDSSRTILLGDPIIWREDDELSGRRIELHFKDHDLSKVFVESDAAAVSGAQPGDPRNNYLVGKTLTLTTVDDSSRLIVAKGDAKGEYHAWDEADVYQGVNMSAADRIELLVVNNKATSIVLSGRSNGTFYPPGQAPEDIGLGSFRDRDHKRRKTN